MGELGLHRMKYASVWRATRGVCPSHARACVALERATEARSQPRNHADINGIGLADLGQRLARRAPFDGFVALVFRELGPAAELDACLHGALAAVTGALPDEVALELGNCGQQRREKTSLRAGSIPERVAEAPEGCAGLADALDQVEQLAGAAAEPVELGDQDDVAGLEAGHQLGQLRPICPGAADLLAIDCLGASGLERLKLAGQM